MSLTILSEPGLDPKTLSLDEKIELIKESDGLLIDLLEGETIDNLYLSWCTSLTHLPDNLKLINGDLDLEECSSLTHLPENLKVNGFLDLDGCTSLTRLPNDLEVGGWLSLAGCTSLKEIPSTIKVGGKIYVPEHLSR